MAIDSSLTREVGKKGVNKKSQFEWPSSELIQGDSDSESTSVTSSMQGSTSSATSSLDQDSKGGTRQMKTTSKSTAKKLTTFGSFMSSRRRAQSRLSQSSTKFSDNLSTTLDHPSSNEVSDESPDYLQKPTPKFTRTGSLRTVKLFRSKSKSSSKSRKSSTVKSSEISEDLHLERATFSSTLKDSKFPEQLKVEAGPLEPEDILPVAKFCPYQHCSLHGHHHHHEPPKERFAYLKRRTAKDQKSVHQESQTEKRSGKKRGVKATKAVSDESKSGKGNSGIRENMDDSIELYAKTRSGPLIEASHGHDDDVDFADILFGVNSFHYNHKDDRNSRMEDQDSNADLRSSVDLKDEKNGNSNGSNGVLENKAASKKVNHISMWHMIHRHMISGLTAEPGNELIPQVVEEKQPHTEDFNSSPQIKDFDNDNAVNQETEIRKMFAIKLVREAIEKILLPEVQDDQSTTSEVISEKDPSEKTQTGDEISSDPKEAPQAANDVPEEENKTEEQVENEPEKRTVDVPEHEKKTEEKVEEKPEKRTPKSWSYLKKVILLTKFVKELEKVKKFNPKKPRQLPMVPEPESEKVSLRRQMVGDKKNADEWMLDYALQKVVSELAPTQKRKVSLLVKAFETVAPTHEDQHTKVTTPKNFRSNAELRRVTSETKDNFRDVSESSLDLKVESKRDFSDEVARGNELDKEKRIKMWHMIYQHVVTDIATKVGSELLRDGEESVNGEDKNMQEVEDQSERKYRLGFTQSDAVKLVRESVDEILQPEDTQSIASDIASDQDELLEKKDSIVDKSNNPTTEGAGSTVGNKLEPQKSKNWSKIKKLILVKRSIKALESFRKLKPQTPLQPVSTNNQEGDRVDLRSQMMDERKKAEQWMLDYAVQHMVTKLTPARKKRVSMLVEAFEAIVPLPET